MLHTPSTSCVHALTVDVEDWPQSTLDHTLPITERAVVNTRRMLELFENCQVHGTFFVLGRLARRFPDIVREIANAGHEIASHGYSHKPVYKIGPKTFAEEIDYTAKLLEDISGQRVLGFRAPDFSITAESLWALDLLAEAGATYDSSVMPVKMRRYGIDGFPANIHRLPGGLIEAPLSTVSFGRRRWPIAGGGYLRLYPYSVTATALRRLEDEQRPAIVYLHPYEIDPDELAELDLKVPFSTRLTQSTGRRFIARRLTRLFNTFRFAPLSTVIRNTLAPPRSSVPSTPPAPASRALIAVSSAH